MRRTAVLLACALLLTGAAVGCSSEKSPDEIAKECVTAIKARPDGDKAKPKACEGLSDDDYQALLMLHVLEDGGWVDKDGNVDVDKLLETPSP